MRRGLFLTLIAATFALCGCSADPAADVSKEKSPSADKAPPIAAETGSNAMKSNKARTNATMRSGQGDALK